MKTKIKAALQQKYPQLGLAEEVFEGVASAVETLITDEAAIPAFVDGAEAMLKRYQADADKLRGHKKLTDDLAAEKKRADELAAKIKEMEGKQTPPATEPDHAADQAKETPDVAKIVADAVANAIKPLQDELNAINGERTKSAAVNAAKEAFFGNDYAKKYTAERDYAWEIALELNEAKGGNMTAEELGKAAMAKFDKFVSNKGVDTSKPFEPDKTDGKSDELDTDEIRRACGLKTE